MVQLNNMNMKNNVFKGMNNNCQHKILIMIILQYHDKTSNIVK